jgi:hypothetical protein
MREGPSNANPSDASYTRTNFPTHLVKHTATKLEHQSTIQSTQYLKLLPRSV